MTVMRWSDLWWRFRRQWSNPLILDWYWDDCFDHSTHQDNCCDHSICNKDAEGHDISEKSVPEFVLDPIKFVDGLIFHVCQDVNIDDTPTSNLYVDEGSFGVYYDSVSCCNDFESNTQVIIEHFILSLDKDGYIQMHHLEDPFDEVLSYWCHHTFIQDSIIASLDQETLGWLDGCDTWIMQVYTSTAAFKRKYLKQDL